ncbi:MAG: cyclic nucleotide-binding domain-containing protein [Ardenticatenaceae bacterium]|nr:cyclic nucleotide-binding domain-containing protein [Ardenticatenaceae bacterium]
MYTEKPRFGPEQYATGATIIRQGDLPEKFYIITNGYVDVEHRGAEGVHVIDRLGPGDFFGEIGLMKNKRRNATVRARTDVAVMAMDQQTFARWLNTSGLVQEELAELMDIREKRVEKWGGSDDAPVAEAAVSQPQTNVSGTTAVPQSKSRPSNQGPLQFNAGDILVRQGAPANRFYIIMEGEVEVVQKDEQGIETIISHLNDGQYFGEIGLLEEGSIRTATVRAITHVKVLPFTRDQFRSWLAKSPDSKTEIEKTAYKRLSRDTGPLQQKKR